MTRRKARETAFILLFEYSFAEESAAEILEQAKEARELETDAFSTELFCGAAEKTAELDSRIEPALHNWSKERLSRVALTVLRLAVYEMTCYDDTPVSVAINEAVELAKLYGGAEDAAFVNGVLGAVART